MMKISKNDLKETLSIAQATLGNGPDITSHFLFEKVGDEVFVSACNPPRIYSSIPLKGCKIDEIKPVEGEEENGEATEKKDAFQSFTLEGKRILKAINAVNGLLTIEVDSGSVSITSDKGTLELSSLDPTVFPPWRELLSASTLMTNVPANVMHDTLSISKPYANSDEVRRPELAQVLFTDGMAFSCDSFGLCMSKSDSFKDLEAKFHLKDISPACKFLKSYDGHSIKVLDSTKATFLQSEDGGVFGMMELPFDMPKAITSRYIDAFDWVPRRVWRIEKEEFNNSLDFLSSGADESNLKVTLIDSESETFSPPRLEMLSVGNNVQTYSLDPAELSVELTEDFDLNTIEDLGERLYASRMLADKKGETEGDDIESFSFNIGYMKRSLVANHSEHITFGCNREDEKRGYMIFKQQTDSGATILSVLGWMV
jgi:hypothetical protein